MLFSYMQAYTLEINIKKYSNTVSGPLAQLVEHFPFKEGVIGSNPIRLTKKVLNSPDHLKFLDI